MEGFRMKILLKNAYVVTMDPNVGVYTRGGVIVENDRILCLQRRSAHGRIR